jgi:hypothetical protein
VCENEYDSKPSRSIMCRDIIVSCTGIRVISLLVIPFMTMKKILYAKRIKIIGNIDYKNKYEILSSLSVVLSFIRDSKYCR